MDVVADDLAVLGEEGLVEALGPPADEALALALAPGHQAVEGQVDRGQLHQLTRGGQAPVGQVDDQLGGQQGALGGGDGLAEAGGAGQEAIVEFVAQADEGDLRQGDLGVAGVGQFVVAQDDDPVVGGGVIEVRAALEGFADQDVGQVVLGPAEEAQGIAQVVAHGLAAAGDGDVERGGGIGGEVADQLGDGVGSALVVLRGADVVQRLALGVRQGVDMADVEADGREGVVLTQAVKPAGLLAQQTQAGGFGAFVGGEQVDLGGDEGRLALDRQGIEGLRDHLGGEPGHGENDPARIRVVRHGVPFLLLGRWYPPAGGTVKNRVVLVSLAGPGSSWQITTRGSGVSMPQGRRARRARKLVAGRRGGGLPTSKAGQRSLLEVEVGLIVPLLVLIHLILMILDRQRAVRLAHRLLFSGKLAPIRLHVGLLLVEVPALPTQLLGVDQNRSHPLIDASEFIPEIFTDGFVVHGYLSLCLNALKSGSAFVPRPKLSHFRSWTCTG